MRTNILLMVMEFFYKCTPKYSPVDEDRPANYAPVDVDNSPRQEIIL